MKLISPKKIHDFPILINAYFPKEGISRGGWVILIYRGHNFLTPFVTACLYHTDGIFDEEWDSGNYFSDLEEALADWNERVTYQKAEKI